MHIAISIALFLGFALVLVFGLLSVVQDLLERGAQEQPMLPDPEQQLSLDRQSGGAQGRTSELQGPESAGQLDPRKGISDYS